jgi:hypothetical protein
MFFMLIVSFFSGKFTPEYFTKLAQEFSGLLANGEHLEHKYLVEFDALWSKLEAGDGVGTNYLLVNFDSFVPGMPFGEFLKLLKYGGMTVDQKGFSARICQHKLTARKNKDRKDLVNFDYRIVLYLSFFRKESRS